MNTWEKIERSGFYPNLVASALRRALGGVEPEVSLCQTHTDFDHSGVFRHVSIAALSHRCIILVHADEIDEGVAEVSTSTHPLSQMGSFAVRELWSQPSSEDPQLDELLISLDVGAMRRLDIDPAHCDDPQCRAEHGFSGIEGPAEIAMRISRAADGAEELADAYRFLEVLTQRLEVLQGA